MGIAPWKIETTNPFDRKASFISVKSNIWPGAFAVTRDKYALIIIKILTTNTLLLLM